MKLQVISYDIPDDGVRQKVAEVLKNYGLIRIQYSVFNGLLPKAKMKDLLRELEDILRDDVGDIAIFELCESCQKHTTTIYSVPDEQPPEKEEPAKPKDPKKGTAKKEDPPEKGKGVLIF